jgi:hypothetical protein
MSLLFYSENTHVYYKKLKDIIKAQVPCGELEIYHEMNSLSNRFNKLRCDINIMVLVAATQNDLTELIIQKQLFDDIPIILILPDRNKETISKGLKLSPRFFDYIDSDFYDFASVLKKMLKNIRIKTDKMYEKHEEIDTYDNGAAKNVFAL